MMQYDVINEMILWEITSSIYEEEPLKCFRTAKLGVEKLV